MFLTPANNTRSAGALLILCAAVLFCSMAADEGVVTSEITSNSIYALAGSNDTIWMATASGLNYTVVPTVAVADSFVWWGLKTTTAVSALSYQGGQFWAGIDIESRTYNYDRLFHFEHRTGQFNTVDPGWDLSGLVESIRSTTYLDVSGIVSVDTTFFLAAGNGGLVSWNAVGSRRKTFYPGRNAFVCALNSFPSPIVTPFPDSNLAVGSLAVEKRSADSSRICTMLPKKLWFFSLRDTTWDSSTIVPADPLAVIQSCLRLFAVQDSMYSTLYATIASSHADGSAPDTSLYRYNRTTNSWTIFLAARYVHSLSGRNSRLYLIADNEIALYIDSGGPPTVPLIPKSQFRQRIQAAGDIPDNCQFTDILLMPHRFDSEASLCIASSFGLFYTRTEFAHEQAQTPFVHLVRSRVIQNNLKETYAVPGIVNAFSVSDPANPQVYFAYNLQKDALVTIRILDWNMNPVKNVVKNAPRQAGSSRAEGRSTNMNEDLWDCRDRYGRRVPVGVYYYEIASNQGERAFGKIVVAFK